MIVMIIYDDNDHLFWWSKAALVFPTSSLASVAPPCSRGQSRFDNDKFHEDYDDYDGYDGYFGDFDDD